MLNLMIVFLASGLWHGASWNFVIWGFLHGLFRVIGEAGRNTRRIITTSTIPNTTANYITIKISPKLTIVDTPGFIDKNAIYNFVDYNKLARLYPSKEIRVKTFQIRPNYSIVINDILRIDNISDKTNSFSFYMNDKLRYEKVKIKNDKLKILPNIIKETEEKTDIIINGLGFIRITKEAKVKIYTLDLNLIEIRKSMI